MNKIQLVFVFSFLVYSSLEANENLNDNIEANNVLSEEDFIDHPEVCSELLEIFAQSAANFTLCSITNARPIRLCEKCIEKYMNFTDAFRQLLDKDINNGTTCRLYFISRDRFDVILEYHDHIMTVWDKGHCNDCFEFSDGVKPRLSNQTIHFNQMAEDTMNCIHSNKSTNNTEEVCIRCMEKYIKLNEFYGTLSKDSIGVDSVCMDTVDLMNHTRSIWSKKLNCCKMRQSPEIAFLCCSVIISLLPLLYYIVVRFTVIKDLPNVLKESRFKQSILRSVQDSVVN